MEGVKRTVVFFLGSTASGKSRLALDVAKRLNGEIINADSMQVYENYGVMTAKPTEEERKEVPHHLYDYVPVTTLDYALPQYLKDLQAVLDTIPMEKLPIVVGGTNYFIEHFLFEQEKPQPVDINLSDLEKMMGVDELALHLEMKALFWEVEGPPTEDFDKDVAHSLLKAIDPPMADFFSVNDTR